MGRSLSHTVRCKAFHRCGLTPNSGYVEFVVNKVAQWFVHSEYFGFSCQFLFRQPHLLSGAGTTGPLVGDVPNGHSLDPPNNLGRKLLWLITVLWDYEQCYLTACSDRTNYRQIPLQKIAIVIATAANASSLWCRLQLKLIPILGCTWCQPICFWPFIFQQLAPMIGFCICTGIDWESRWSGQVSCLLCIWEHSASYLSRNINCFLQSL
jgi:hypothetical protein